MSDAVAHDARTHAPTHARTHARTDEWHHTRTHGFWSDAIAVQWDRSDARTDKPADASIHHPGPSGQG